MTSYSVIPSSAEVDNITIDKNANGEIEIKSGEVTENILSTNLMTKVNHSIIFDTKSNNYIFSYSGTEQNNSTTSAIQYSKKIIVSKDLPNAIIGHMNSIYNGKIEIYINGVLKITYTTSTPSGEITKYQIDLFQGDEIVFKMYKTTTSSGWAVIYNIGIVGYLNTYGFVDIL